MDWKQAWALQDRFTLHEAVLLGCEINPADSKKDAFLYPDSFEPLVKTLIRFVLHLERTKAEAEGSTITWRNRIIPETELIKRDDALKWYEECQLWPSVFYRENQAAGYRGYLDKGHPHYSKKLAAAVQAWEALAKNPGLFAKGSPKDAVIKWLTKNRDALELGDGEDGEIPFAATDQIGRVVNWKPEGGAAKTIVKK